MLIFCSYFPIFHSTESINNYYNSFYILNYRLPQNWALGAPNPPKKGKIAIFPKLKGQECSFVFLSPIFHSTEDIITFKNVNMSEHILCNLCLSEDRNKNEHTSPFSLENMVILPILGGFGANFGAPRGQFWGNR